MPVVEQPLLELADTQTGAPSVLTMHFWPPRQGFGTQGFDGSAVCVGVGVIVGVPPSSHWPVPCAQCWFGSQESTAQHTLLTQKVDWQSLLTEQRSPVGAGVERCVAVTRDVLRATVELARSRGAEPLILVPRFGIESDIDRMLRQRILADDGLPYVEVELDAGWRLAWDRHPNAHAAHVIAEAVAARLRQSWHE